MGNNSLKGKSILFFCPYFFGYEAKIADKMKALGADVDWFDERSIKSAYCKALLKVVPLLFTGQANRYYKKILNEHRDKSYDYILIVRCDMVSGSILKQMKKIFPKAKLCLYLWDSMNNVPGIKAKLRYFDLISSFDMRDCENNKSFKFRPLFYCDEYEGTTNQDLKIKYDLCFIGTIHSDRYKILKEIIKQADENDLSFYFYPYLQSKFIYYFYKLTKKEFKDTNINDFRYEKLDSKIIADVIGCSRIVVDIQHPKQTGLTIRTIETFGMRKKMITTNMDIYKYDLYLPSNILVIDRNKPTFSIKSLLGGYQMADAKIYEKYSIESWICGALGIYE